MIRIRDDIHVTSWEDDCEHVGSSVSLYYIAIVAVDGGELHKKFGLWRAESQKETREQERLVADVEGLVALPGIEPGFED